MLTFLGCLVPREVIRRIRTIIPKERFLFHVKVSVVNCAVSKKCNKPRSGKKGSCLGAQIVDLCQVNECQNRDNTTPPTVVNMEQANPLLGQ